MRILHLLHRTLFVVLILGYLMFAVRARAEVIVSAESIDIVNMLLSLGDGAEVTLLDDTAATGGKVARIARVGTFGYGWLYYREAPAAGRYRVTMRARTTAANGSVITTKAISSGDSPYFYHANSALDFSDATPANGFVERSCELLLPATAGNWSLQVFVTAGMDVDWIKMESLAAGASPPVEVVQARTEKLFYPAGANALAKVRLLNTSSAPQAVRLRVRLEKGLADFQTVYDADMTVPVSVGLQSFSVPVGALAAGGATVIAETLDPGGQVLSTARDYVLSGDSPVEVSPIFGVFDGVPGQAPEQVYSAGDAPYTISEQRRNYAAFAELNFWAPCDTTMLTSPPGRTNWWSGTTLKRISAGQLQGYKQAADAQGIGLVAYANYGVSYGWRLLEAARKQPEILAWDKSNDNNPLDYTLFAFGYGPDRAAPLDSRQRREDEAQWNYTGPDGAARVIMSNPAMLKRHADQLVASMQQFGWLGFRYDDPLAYDTDQVDLFGRQAPFGGWSNEAMIRYFRDRLKAQNPGAVYGRNSDGMRATSGSAGYTDEGGKTTQSSTEAAILRGGGGFLLQEAFTAYLASNHSLYTEIRDYYRTGGRNAKAGEGHIFAIVPMNAFANDGEREYVAALAGAAGVQLAYQPSTTPYMQFLARYSGLLFGKRVQPVETPAPLVRVDAGTHELWWSNYVYCHYAGAGHRQYVVHLVNPPATPRVADTANSPEPPTVGNVLVNFSLPLGWTATKATLLTPDNRGVLRSFVESVQSKFSTQYSEPNEITEAITKFPSSQPLVLAGTSVTVPQLAKWSVVVLDCSGPSNDLPDGPPSNLPPLPVVPDVNQPPDAPLVASALYLERPGTWPVDAALLIADPSARGGTAFLITTNAVEGEQAYFSPTKSEMGRAGNYKFTLRVRTETDAAKDLHLNVRNDGREPVPYSIDRLLDTATLTPADGYREFTLTLALGEASQFGLAWVLQNPWPGLVIDYLRVELLTPAIDAERLPLRGEATWPGNNNVPDFARRQVPRVWFGGGLYHDYFRIQEALRDVAPSAQVVSGDLYLYGADNRGWNGIPFPGTPAALMQKDLIVLADVPINNNVWPVTAASGLAWIDWLRHYVEKGGRVLLTGGPYGFGRGGWNSDLIAPILPVTLIPRTVTGLGYDLQPISGGAGILQPAGLLAAGLDWSTPASVMWLHQATARPDATVQATVDGHPAIVTGNYGAGRVAVVLAAPLGDVPAGQTAFWDAPQWRPLMSNVVGWLLAPDPTAGPVISPDPGTYSQHLTLTLDSLRPGAAVRYTIDGSTPTETQGVLYTGPFVLNQSATVKAVSFGEGLPTSGVTSAPFTVAPASHGVFHLHTAQIPATPNASDNRPYELGTKFQSLQSGRITKIRYYKSSGETGAHTGRVWSSTGAALARVDFVNETASGWQEQALPEPLPITANTTYVVSVNANTEYAYTDQGLAVPLTVGPLATVADEANGVFGNPGMFPSYTTRTRDYFREVTFITEGVGPPQIQAVPVQFIDENANLSFTNLTTVVGLPLDTVTFSLAPGGPAGATLNSATGVFNWTPNEAQGPSTNLFELCVTDNVTGLRATNTFTVIVNEMNSSPMFGPRVFRPAEYGTTVHGFQDDFDRLTLEPDWISVGKDAEAYSLANGVLKVRAAAGDLNHLLYSGTNYDDTVQEVLARIKLNGPNPAYVGVAVGVGADSKGLNYVFRPDPTPGLHTQFLDNGRVFGPELNFGWGASRWYWIRLRQQPNLDGSEPDAWAKIWLADGTVPEPADWEIWNYAPENSIRQGRAGISAGTNGAADGFEVDYILIVAAGLPEIQVSPSLSDVQEGWIIPDMTVNEGDPVSYQLVAWDPDLPKQTLTFSLDPSAPAGAAVDPVTGKFSWTPSEAQGPGSYPITVRVTDDGTPPLSDARTFTVTVKEVNAAPVLAPIGSISVDEGSALHFVVAASDPNDIPPNQLSLRATGLPAGATFDSVTGAFAWTPIEAQGPGNYSVTFTVTDDGQPPLSASETIGITVNKVVPPRIENLRVSLGNGNISFSWTARAGKTYKVQYKGSLGDADWKDLPVAPTINGATGSISDPIGPDRERYYRIAELE